MLSHVRSSDVLYRYFLHYHPCFAVLEPMLLPDTVHQHSMLLFWTIILITALRDEGDLSLTTALIPIVRRLLWSTISAPPYNLPSLQAMSLLCMWPLPTSSMSTDISFVLAGIVRSAALHIGIHRPEILEDYSRSRYQLGHQELRDAVRVWSGCYIAAERYVKPILLTRILCWQFIRVRHVVYDDLRRVRVQCFKDLYCTSLFQFAFDYGSLMTSSVTITVGQQLVSSPDNTIENACKPENPYHLPRDLYSHLLVSRFCSRVHQAMGGVEWSLSNKVTQTTGSVLMPLFEEDFTILEKRINIMPSSTFDAPTHRKRANENSTQQRVASECVSSASGILSL